MNIRKTLSIVTLAALAVAAAPSAIAADLSDVGFIDQASIGALPQFQRANAQVAQYKSQLDAQYAAAARGRSQAEQQRLAGPYQEKFFNRQRQVLGPLFARAQAAIAQTASNQKLSVVVDKRIVVFGGQDITKNVIDLINEPGVVVPPSATPPPSEIGFVDQGRIDQVPKIKQANDDFMKYAASQRQNAIKQMQGAKNNPQQQQQIFQNYQKMVSTQQDKTLKPLVDQTRDAISKVAKTKSLILVIDRSDVIYGGMDITQDVQNALK